MAHEYKSTKLNSDRELHNILLQSLPELDRDRVHAIAERLGSHNLETFNRLLKHSKCGPQDTEVSRTSSLGSNTTGEFQFIGMDSVNVVPSVGREDVSFLDERLFGMPSAAQRYPSSAENEDNGVQNRLDFSESLENFYPHGSLAHELDLSRSPNNYYPHTSLAHGQTQATVGETRALAGEASAGPLQPKKGEMHLYVQPSEIFSRAVRRLFGSCFRMPLISYH